jgi:peptide-methionine (S)-S-oxide reductase
VAETQSAIFGAGCFWGIEASFRKVDGVKTTSVGYSGGAKANPTYEEVCSGTTGHAEVVRVEFDPDVVTYESLLDLFWQIHDPTTMNRQGPDIGTQYRSAIYYLDEDQAAAARASKEACDKSGRFPAPIVTEITAASDYWMAEDYHQQYFEKQRGRFGRFF